MQPSLELLGLTVHDLEKQKTGFLRKCSSTRVHVGARSMALLLRALTELLTALFNSQFPHGSLQGSITSVPEVLTPLTVLSSTRYIVR